MLGDRLTFPAGITPIIFFPFSIHFRHQADTYIILN